MPRITVLGAGMVGRAMAADLARDHDVTVVDLDTEALARAKRAHGLATRQADCSDPRQVAAAVADADLVVGAVPGFLGYRTLRAVLEAGKPAVDISFFPEDPFGLDELARTKGLTAVVDIGVAPGMDNVLLGYHEPRMTVERFTCLVGGLPVERRWPYAYTAPFSPIDVLEEYTRPARVREHGVEVVHPALSGVEPHHFPGIGTLEAFHSDGLRSLLRSSRVPNLSEKTLRYPGHAELMRVFRESGFFGTEPIEVRGQDVRPIDLTARLLFDQWTARPGEGELTVMRVLLEGHDGQGPVRHAYDLLDRGADGVSSMARTTGYTATAAARLVLDGGYAHAGISPPEYLGRDEAAFRFLLDELAARGVHYAHTEEREE